MFDLTSSKLLILGLVALIVVGPKELPMLLRTLGKYMGMIRRQANEFRAQFDDAMRETELEQLKKDVEGMGHDMQATIREAEASVEREVASANAEIDGAMGGIQHPAIAAEPGTTGPGTSIDHLSGEAAAPLPAPTTATPTADATPVKTGA